VESWKQMSHPSFCQQGPAGSTTCHSSRDIPALFDQKIYTPKMSAQNGEVVGDDTIRQTGCVSSNPQDHIQFASQYLELGFDQLYFHTAGSGQKQFLKDYGRDVLPRSKEKASQTVS
jgi:hypothetical protein